MSNENNNSVVEEPIKKTSKLKKNGRSSVSPEFTRLRIGGAGGSCYYSYKIVTMNLETAKLQLEAAQTPHRSSPKRESSNGFSFSFA